MRSGKFQKGQYDPPTIRHKRVNVFSAFSIYCAQADIERYCVGSKLNHSCYDILFVDMF